MYKLLLTRYAINLHDLSVSTHTHKHHTTTVFHNYLELHQFHYKAITMYKVNNMSSCFLQSKGHNNLFDLQN